MNITGTLINLIGALTNLEDLLLSMIGALINLMNITGTLTSLIGALTNLTGAVMNLEGALTDLEGAIMNITVALTNLEAALMNITGAPIILIGHTAPITYDRADISNQSKFLILFYAHEGEIDAISSEIWYILAPPTLLSFDAL